MPSLERNLELSSCILGMFLVFVRLEGNRDGGVGRYGCRVVRYILIDGDAAYSYELLSLCGRQAI